VILKPRLPPTEIARPLGPIRCGGWKGSLTRGGVASVGNTKGSMSVNRFATPPIAQTFGVNRLRSMIFHFGPNMYVCCWVLNGRAHRSLGPVTKLLSVNDRKLLLGAAPEGGVAVKVCPLSKAGTISMNHQRSNSDLTIHLARRSGLAIILLRSRDWGSGPKSFPAVLKAESKQHFQRVWTTSVVQPEVTIADV
jgi:hypothetical protein